MEKALVGGVSPSNRKPETIMPRTKTKTADERALPSVPAAEPVTDAYYHSELHQSDGRWVLVAEDDKAPVPTATGLVPALENAIAMIDYINRTPPHSAQLSEITSVVSVSKSHCHNILKTLVHFGWLSFDQRRKTYAINAGILTYVSSFLGSSVLNRIRPELLAFVERTGVPAVLLQPMPDETFVVIDKFNGAQTMEVTFPIGHHYPRDAVAATRAFLAWQSPQVIATWMANWRRVDYTGATLLTAKAVRAEITATRERGYARSVEEFTVGLMALGIPIFDSRGDVIYVVCCSDLTGNILPREKAIAEALVHASANISLAILGQAPPDFGTGRSERSKAV